MVYVDLGILLDFVAVDRIDRTGVLVKGIDDAVGAGCAAERITKDDAFANLSSGDTAVECRTDLERAGLGPGSLNNGSGESDGVACSHYHRCGTAPEREIELVGLACYGVNGETAAIEEAARYVVVGSGVLGLEEDVEVLVIDHEVARALAGHAGVGDYIVGLALVGEYVGAGNGSVIQAFGTSDLLGGGVNDDFGTGSVPGSHHTSVVEGIAVNELVECAECGHDGVHAGESGGIVIAGVFLGYEFAV